MSAGGNISQQTFHPMGEELIWNRFSDTDVVLAPCNITHMYGTKFSQILKVLFKHVWSCVITQICVRLFTLLSFSPSWWGSMAFRDWNPAFMLCIRLLSLLLAISLLRRLSLSMLPLAPPGLLLLPLVLVPVLQQKQVEHKYLIPFTYYCFKRDEEAYKYIVHFDGFFPLGYHTEAMQDVVSGLVPSRSSCDVLLKSQQLTRQTAYLKYM